MALTQVSTKGLKDGTITTVDLADDAVTGAKIDGATITGANIANDTIGAAKLQAGIINNSKIASDAAIAGTKISPDFGSQNIASTGQLQVTSQIPAFFKRSVTGASPVTVLIGNNTQSYALEASSTGFTINDYTNINVPRLGINSSGNVFIGNNSSVGTKLHIENASGDAHIRLRGSANYGILFTRHSDAALTGYVGSGNAVNLGGSNVALSAPLSGGDIIFQTNGTAATDEKMRIKSNGAISFTSQNATGWQLNAGDDSASYSAIDNHFPTTNRTLYFNAETTHRSVAFWNKNGSDGYGFGLDNSGNFKVVAGTTEHLKVTGSDGSVLFGGDIRVDRGVTGIDGILGQAYAGYFGLKHADQSINQEYMIISASTHTFISAGANAGVYIRPSANSVTHETFFGINHTQFNTNVLMNSHNILRNDFAAGFLVGAQNSQGASDAKTNPIFTIGTSHLPNNTSLVDMYGIGYSHGNASFTPSGVGWGMYVAADGDSRIYLDGSYGNIHLQDNQGSLIFANDGWSGDRSTGKIQTYFGHMYLQNAGNTASWAFRLPNGTEPFVINYQGGTSSSDRRHKKDITTITGAVDTIKKLIGRSFTWKEADVKGFGVIAQEIESVLPEVISTQTIIEGEDNDDPYKMMNYGALSGHFIEAIKELAAKIEALETEVATLKAS